MAEAPRLVSDIPVATTAVGDGPDAAAATHADAKAVVTALHAHNDPLDVSRANNTDTHNSAHREAAEIVTTLYQTVLKREPDTPGFEDHLGRLKSLDGIAGLRDALQSFLSSQERTRLENRAYLSRIARPSAIVGDDPIRHVISLGTHCFTSFLLKRCQMKRWSGPFDWIFSSPAMIQHCLADDFKTFLNDTYYHRISAGVSGHSFYDSEFGIKSMFNHHDMEKPEARSYFSRCVDRFRTVSASGERSLFLQCVPADRGTANAFAATAKSVAAYAPRCLFVMVAMEPPRSDELMPRVALEETVGSHKLYRLGPVSKLEGNLLFENEIDNQPLARILAQHEIELRHPT